MEEKEIYEFLGAMKADMSHVRKTVDSTSEHLRILSEKSIVNDISIQAAHKRIDDVNNSICCVNKNIEDNIIPILNDVKWFKVKATILCGVLLGIFYTLKEVITLYFLGGGGNGGKV